MLEEERAEAARGYVQRFGNYFCYYRRKFRQMLIVELALNAMVAFLVGFWPTTDGFVNCYIQSSLLLGLFFAHLMLVIITRPQIGRLNNIFCNCLSGVQTLSVMLNGVSSVTRTPGPSQASTVFAVLLTYMSALRALLDVYVYVSQRMYEAGVQWPAIAALTDVHIKAHQALRTMSGRDATADTTTTTTTTSRKRSGSRRRRDSVKVTSDDGGISTVLDTPATRGLVSMSVDGILRRVAPDEYSSNSGIATRWRQVTEARRLGAVSRVMPDELLPFVMRPLADRPLICSRAKTNAFERRRKELAQKVKWAATLQSIRTDRKFDDDSDASSDSDDGGMGGVAGGDGIVSDTTSVVSDGTAVRGFSRRPVRQQRMGDVTDVALNRLLKMADKEEADKKRRAALRASLAEDRPEEGGIEMAERESLFSTSTTSRPTGLSGSNRDPRWTSFAGMSDSLSSIGTTRVNHPYVAPVPPPAAQPKPKASLLGGDLDGWSDDDVVATPAASGRAQEPPPPETPMHQSSRMPLRRVEFKDI